MLYQYPGHISSMNCLNQSETHTHSLAKLSQSLRWAQETTNHKLFLSMGDWDPTKVICMLQSIIYSKHKCLWLVHLINLNGTMIMHAHEKPSACMSMVPWTHMSNDECSWRLLSTHKHSQTLISIHWHSWVWCHGQQYSWVKISIHYYCTMASLALILPWHHTH